MKVLDLLEDKAFSEVSPSNIDGCYSVHGISVDNIKGMGATPFNQNCSYRGFAAFITPSKFLKLALEDNEENERGYKLSKVIRERAIGNPFFMVDYDEEKNLFRIKGHEGRGRMSAIRQLVGDKPFPVHFIGVSELRARHLSAEILEGLVNGEPIMSERKQMVSLETDKIFWMGKTITS